MTTRELLKLAYRNERLIRHYNNYRVAFTPNIPAWFRASARQSWKDSSLSFDGVVTPKGIILSRLLKNRANGDEYIILPWLKGEK